MKLPESVSLVSYIATLPRHMRPYYCRPMVEDLHLVLPVQPLRADGAEPAVYGDALARGRLHVPLFRRQVQDPDFVKLEIRLVGLCEQPHGRYAAPQDQQHAGGPERRVLERAVHMICELRRGESCVADRSSELL